MSNGALGRIGGAHTPVRIKNLSERMPDLNKVRSLSPEVIDVIPNPMRPMDDEVVKSLASSMSKIGLMTPITVRYREDRPSAIEESTDSYELIAGRHRLAAAKLLGWEKIGVTEIECSDIEARLWEISENLHRAELTKLQRDGQLAEWIRLTDEGLSQVAKNPKGGRPGAISAAARELGVSKDDAHRAIKVASLSPDAKAAAIKHGLDDNRSALLEAAKETGPAAQVEKIVERAAKKDKAKPFSETAPARPSDAEMRANIEAGRLLREKHRAPRTSVTNESLKPNIIDMLPIEDDVIGVDAPWIWRLLPEEAVMFLQEHRQVHVCGRQPRWVTLATLKAAVLAGKTAGWFVADYNVETGAFLSTYCASCAP